MHVCKISVYAKKSECVNIIGLYYIHFDYS